MRIKLDPDKDEQRLQAKRDWYVDINDIAWPAGASVIYTNQLEGALLKDLSGSGNHGTFGAGGAAPLPILGPWGTCWQFDGVDDYITKTGMVLPDLSKITVLAVFNVASTTTRFTLGCLGDSLANGTFWVFRGKSGDLEQDLLRVHYSNGTSEWALIEDTDFFSGQSGAIFVAATLDYDSPYACKFYRNGEGAVFSGNMTTPVKVTGTRDFYLSSYSSGLHTSKGTLFAYALIPRIMSASEILAIYNQLFGEWA